MSRILIVPLPESGHILPTLAISALLSSNGHHVEYLTAPQFSSIINMIGGRVIPLIDQDSDVQFVSGSGIWYRFVAQNGGGNRSSLFWEKLQHTIRCGDFDLILCDSILGITHYQNLMLELNGTRLLLFSTSLFNWNDRDPTSLDVETIVLCPEALELDRFRRYRPGVFYVESSLAPLHSVVHSMDIDCCNRPMVLVCFGTQSIGYRHLFDVLRLIESLAEVTPHVQFILATGLEGSMAAGRVPKETSNLLVRPRVPQRLLLKRACAVISHGGLGTLKEGICDAIPQIVIPALHDQAFNAMRIRHHGLGEAVFLDNGSLVKLSSALRKAMEGFYEAQLQGMQTIFNQAEATKISCQLITKYLA